jgi:pilus assembly protein CpaE
MMPGLSFVIVSSDQKLSLALEGAEDVDIRGRVERLADLVQTVDAQRPDALLVSLDTQPELVFETLQKLLSPRPLVIFHGPDDSRLILRAMRSGGYEYITPALDAEDQLLAAIQRAALDSEGLVPAPESPLLALIGSKGGVGTSFTACQLAASLARNNGRVALVDGHQRHGDVALYLDLSPRYDFASLAAGEEPIDATYLHAALASHDSGVAVLAAPQHPEESVSVSTDCVSQVLGLLRAEFDWVLWDTPQDFDDRNLCVLTQASKILLVTTPDVPALHHTKMQLELLSRLGRAKDDVRIVLNRTHSRATVSEKDAQTFLNRTIDASIPNDFPRASACVNEGRTLTEMAPRTSIERSIGELAGLAHTWMGRTAPEPQRRGLLGRFKKRGS